MGPISPLRNPKMGVARRHLVSLVSYTGNALLDMWLNSSISVLISCFSRSTLIILESILLSFKIWVLNSNTEKSSIFHGIQNFPLSCLSKFEEEKENGISPSLWHIFSISASHALVSSAIPGWRWNVDNHLMLGRDLFWVIQIPSIVRMFLFQTFSNQLVSHLVSMNAFVTWNIIPNNVHWSEGGHNFLQLSENLDKFVLPCFPVIFLPSKDLLGSAVKEEFWVRINP